MCIYIYIYIYVCVCVCACVEYLRFKKMSGVCESDAVDDALFHGKLFLAPSSCRMCTDQLQAVMRTKKDSWCQVSGESWDKMDRPSGKHTKNYGTSPLLMGKSTISMTIFNSYVSIAISLFMGIQPNPASPNSKKHSKCDRFATYRPEKNVAVDGQDAPRSL